MKKLGLLIVASFLFVACDSTPKGNKAIYPETYDEIAEEIVEEEGQTAEEVETEDSVSEVNDTLSTAPAPVETNEESTESTE